MRKEGARFRAAAFVATVAGFLLLSGCETVKPLYYWGSYEPLTYAALAKSEKVSGEEQLIYLEKDLEVARSRDESPPPGMCAYMGFLCLNLGEDERGLAYFEMEKELFPESIPFIEKLLQKVSSFQPSFE